MEMYCLYDGFTIPTFYFLWRLKLFLKSSAALIVLPESANALRFLMILEALVLQLHLVGKI